jgi:hypothetical protein
MSSSQALEKTTRRSGHTSRYMGGMHARLLGCVALFLLIGCSSPSGGDEGASDDQAVTADPLAMPTEILSFLKQNNWGQHHLEWHTIRQWDLLDASDQAYAKRQNWARSDIQEGQKGNGLEFLAMHRVMFRTLTGKFPRDASLFVGWQTIPTDPNDPNDPVPSANAGPFDSNKADAIDKIQNHIDQFTSDDDLGLYLETALRPTPGDPSARSSDPSTGLHNYLHNRFSDSNSKIDLGDPSVNLENKRFWRLHGWIESRWTAFRTLKNLSEDDPEYQAALMKGEAMLNPPPGSSGNLGAAYPEPPPASLRHFFINGDF